MTLPFWILLAPLFAGALATLRDLDTGSDISVESEKVVGTTWTAFLRACLQSQGGEKK